MCPKSEKHSNFGNQPATTTRGRLLNSPITELAKGEHRERSEQRLARRASQASSHLPNSKATIAWKHRILPARARPVKGAFAGKPFIISGQSSDCQPKQLSNLTLLSAFTLQAANHPPCRRPIVGLGEIIAKGAARWGSGSVRHREDNGIPK